MRLPGGHLQVGNFQVPVEGVPDGRVPVGEAVAVGLPEQRAQGDDRRRLVRAGLLEAPRLARDRVDARVDVARVRAARQPLDMTSLRRHHEVRSWQRAKSASDLQICRAAYRNRTDDLRITSASL